MVTRRFVIRQNFRFGFDLNATFSNKLRQHVLGAENMRPKRAASALKKNKKKGISPGRTRSSPRGAKAWRCRSRPPKKSSAKRANECLSKNNLDDLILSCDCILKEYKVAIGFRFWSYRMTNIFWSKFANKIMILKSCDYIFKEHKIAIGCRFKSCSMANNYFLMKHSRIQESIKTAAGVADTSTRPFNVSTRLRWPSGLQ